MKTYSISTSMARAVAGDDRPLSEALDDATVSYEEEEELEDFFDDHFDHGQSAHYTTHSKGWVVSGVLIMEVEGASALFLPAPVLSRLEGEVLKKVGGDFIREVD